MTKTELTRRALVYAMDWLSGLIDAHTGMDDEHSKKYISIWKREHEEMRGYLKQRFNTIHPDEALADRMKNVPILDIMKEILKDRSHD